MSGHSKWSKIKRQKGLTDAAKGKIFTKLSNAITIAVREGGGGDPASNFKLRLAIEKARESNMPKDKIERAIERSTGNGEGSALEQAVYEAFGPAGVGIIIEATTDNRQRTVAALKNLLDKNGGVLAASGAVAHMFSYVGQLTIPVMNDETMDAVMNAGAIDFEEGDVIDIYTNPADLHRVKQAVLDAGNSVSDVELIYRPMITTPVASADDAKRVLNLLSLLDEADDVHRVFANFDIAEELL